MKSNSLGLQILWWAEIVVGARALLFLIPVMISKWQIRSLSPSVLEDWFLWVVMAASALYFFIGIASAGVIAAPRSARRGRIWPGSPLPGPRRPAP